MKCASNLATVAGLLLIGAMACTTGTEPLASDPESPEPPESPGQEPPPPNPEEPPPPPPPPPPPSGDCTVIVDAVDGPPEGAINAAQSGDVVCLVGAFGLEHTYTVGNSRAGVNSMLFNLTVGNVTVDGSAATITGDFAQAQNISISVGASNTRLTGFELSTGFVVVSAGISNIILDHNHISYAVFPNGNAGLIRTLGGASGGTADVFIEDNVLEQLHGCNADTCSPGSAVPWNQASDVLHLGCVTKQGAGGDHTIARNTMQGCPSLIFLKHPDPGAVVLIEDNTFIDAERAGKGGSVSVTPVTSGNSYENVGDCTSCWEKG